MRPARLVIAILAALALAPAAASAQAPYPNRVIRMIVPFPAGGATDVFARHYAQRMSALLGQQVIVENKSGAAGAIGTLEVARSEPNGYTHAVRHGVDLRAVQFVVEESEVRHPQGLHRRLPKWARRRSRSTRILRRRVISRPSSPSPRPIRASCNMVRRAPGPSCISRPSGSSTNSAASTSRIFPTGAAGRRWRIWSPGKFRWRSMRSARRCSIIATAGSGFSRLRPRSVRRSRPIFRRSTRRSAPRASSQRCGTRLPSRPPRRPTWWRNCIETTNRLLADKSFAEQMLKIGIETSPPRTLKETREFIVQEQARWKPVIEAAGVSSD